MTVLARIRRFFSLTRLARELSMALYRGQPVEIGKRGLYVRPRRGWR